MKAEEALRWVEELLSKHGKQLTDLQRLVFLGSWEGKAYEAIHQDCGFRCSLDHLKRNVGYQLWKLLSEVLGQKVLKNTLQGRVIQAWQQQTSPSPPSNESFSDPESDPESNAVSLSDLSLPSSVYGAEQPEDLSVELPDELLPEPHVDWGGTPLTLPFYGRTKILSQLDNVIRLNLCRLISLYGITGIGKTALTLQLARQVKDQFEFVIWRSLSQAPSLADLLTELTGHFSRQQNSSSDLKQFMHYMANHRCLVILDGIDAVLRDGVDDSSYREGYEDYGDLLRQVGMTFHESCLIVIGWENPQVISEMSNPQAFHYTELKGLGVSEIRELFTARGCTGSDREWRELTRRYCGHPLVLSAIATDIRELFQGKTAWFLEQARQGSVPEELWRRLGQQLRRLSKKEQLVVHCLQQAEDPVAIAALQTALKHQLAEAELMHVLRSLRRRALIEMYEPGRCMLQRLVMEYLQRVGTE